jgi:hypothetical protein
MCASAPLRCQNECPKSRRARDENIYTVRALLTPQAECIYSPLRLTKINALFYCAACALLHIMRAMHLSLCYSWASLSVCCTAAAPLIYARRAALVSSETTANRRVALENRLIENERQSFISARKEMDE